MPKLLSIVVCMASITWLMQIVASVIRVRAWTPKGLMDAFGNRDHLPPPTPLAGRAERTARNTLENFVLFAALALVAQAAGASAPGITQGAEWFLWGRLAYIPVYLLGIPFLRTAVWAFSIAGLAMMIKSMV